MPRHPASARLLLLAALALASLFSLFMLLVRPLVVGGFSDAYLVWNLFLAWIPLGFALLFYDRAKRGELGIPGLALAAGWLAFLPNAPYILTDLIHLQQRESADHILFDALMITSFAWTGLFLGLVSLYLVHSGVARLRGRLAGWAVAGIGIVLSGFGIYLGRFLRWNTWDVLTNPTRLAKDVIAPFTDPVANRLSIGVTLAFAAFMVVAYLVMYAFASLRERVR